MRSLSATRQPFYSVAARRSSRRQELIRSIEFDTLSGFTSLRLNDTLVTEVDKTAIGFNVSANVIWPLGSHFGVGAVTRYARATVKVDPGQRPACLEQ